jgi:hypothetical protein
MTLRPVPTRPPARLLPAGVVLLLAGAILLPGCASHSRDLAAVRASLLSGDVPQAVAEFEKQDGKDNDLLWLLERGYMLHLGGQWEESNQAFEAAELRSEELYTKSVSRQAAALLTSDLALPYRALPYELQMVQYYRALNYLELGLRDDALVEARKANQLLAELSEKDPDEAATRENAFLYYFTGLLYESEGEINDAIVSLRDADTTYASSRQDFGVTAPSWVGEDYFAAADYLGLEDETEKLVASDSTVVTRSRAHDENNLVVFFESGFVPYREAADITLPIFDTSGNKADPWDRATRYTHRYGSRIYTYRAGTVEVDHVLRFAFPYLVDPPSLLGYCELTLPDGQVLRAQPALDLGAVAHAEFQDRIPGMLLKTIARAFAKETARKQAKKQDTALGWVVNAINVATEQADTRSWIFLPRRIDLVKAAVPPGTDTVIARFRDFSGKILDEWTLEVTSAPGETQFVSVRSFQ